MRQLCLQVPQEKASRQVELDTWDPSTSITSSTATPLQATRELWPLCGPGAAPWRWPWVCETGQRFQPFPSCGVMDFQKPEDLVSRSEWARHTWLCDLVSPFISLNLGLPPLQNEDNSSYLSG